MRGAILHGMPPSDSRLVRACRALLVLALVLQTYLLYVFHSSGAEGELFPHADKVVHACMFGGPALLALLGRWRWVALMLAFYAPISELIQGTDVVERDTDWRDALADVTGIILAWGLTRLLRRRA